jgi:PIN domain nuclease of toxin-antitoxin system
VRLLLDTNILLWALIEPSKLKSDVRLILEDPQHDVLFSAASIWEIAIKASLGRADFQVPPDRIVASAHSAGFVELPVRSAAATKVSTLPYHHRDPFDRLLVAQAMTEPTVLYTADVRLLEYSELVVCV